VLARGRFECIEEVQLAAKDSCVNAPGNFVIWFGPMHAIGDYGVEVRFVGNSQYLDGNKIH
jgi:hypothetical protein